MLSFTDRLLSGLLLETPGDGGGGGGAPAGTPSSTGAPAEPAVYDVSDDNALIRTKGSEKPVKFSEYSRGLQAQFTKASQRAAAFEKALTEERTRRTELERAAQSQSQTQPQRGDVYADLRKLPYLKGEDAVKMVENIGGAFQQRDAILLATLKELAGMKQALSGLSSTHSSSQFETFIEKWRQDAGYSPEDVEDMKIFFLAHEGDDLYQEVPRLYEEHRTRRQKSQDAQRQAKVQAARKAPFVPGRGGSANPSKPLTMKGNESPSQIADSLWEAMQAGASELT